MSDKANQAARKQARHKRRTAAIVLIVILLFVWWYGTFTLSVTTQTISNEKIQSEVTIVHLTDLHGATFGKDNADLVAKVRQQQPDLIAVTGDMYTHGDNKGRQTALSLMEQLTDIAPVYYVNGEHDHGEAFAAQLEEVGVNALRYEDERLEINGTPIHLYGITNVYYTATFDLANEFTLDENAYCVLLAHVDHFEKFAQFGIDLSLCGDTHGGQVRLPFIGAVFLPDSGLFPELRGARVKGLYRKRGKLMYVSGGLGNYPVPLRFCNCPEIAVIKLQPTQ